MTETHHADGYLLVVEDDPTLCDKIARVLEAQGYFVHTARDGLEACRYLRELPPPRLILLDLELPCASGWSFLERRRRDPMMTAIPVVVTTADSSGGAWMSEVSVVLWEPVGMEALLAAVTHYAARDDRGAGPVVTSARPN